MTQYLYRCPNCKKEEVVEHSMNEIGNFSKETALKVTCNPNTCQSEDKAELGVEWFRVPQSPSLLTYGSGTYDKGGLKSIKDKQAHFAKRSEKDNTKQGIDEQKIEKNKEIVNQFK